MPTDQGGETIGERLDRKRAELSRVRATIARHETNGSEVRIGLGTQITQVAYEHALRREKDLAADIAALERRLAGATSAERLAILATVTPSS